MNIGKRKNVLIGLEMRGRNMTERKTMEELGYGAFMLPQNSDTDERIMLNVLWLIVMLIIGFCVGFVVGWLS